MVEWGVHCRWMFGLAVDTSAQVGDPCTVCWYRVLECIWLGQYHRDWCIVLHFSTNFRVTSC